MVQVSDCYKSLSQQHGRRVYAKVAVGNEVFLDDRLMEFSFDDVTHPDWYTVGTTCSNRFHFVAKSDSELPSGAEVRPYISFDNAEWCPLGVFYISRRYLRRGIIKITAYDKLYSLDMEWSYDGVLPSDTVSLLRQLCSDAGLEAVEYGHPYEVEKLPAGATVRDMIGYIAGINRACAKIDRYGRLVFKRSANNGFVVSDMNCMEIQRNAASTCYTAIRADTGKEVLFAGSGGELMTLDMYNPLATEEILEDLLPSTLMVEYYGAELTMQGLPFLESGEGVYVQDRGEFYPVIICEMELYYNGGLTATIHSRNKTNVDALVHEDDLESEIKRLEQLFTALSMKQVNNEAITLGSAPEIIADFSFKAAAGAFAELHVSAELDSGTAELAGFSVFLNGVKQERVIRQTLTAGSRELSAIYHLEQNLLNGDNRIYFTAATSGGSAVIPAEGLLAGLVVHGGVAVVAEGAREKLIFAERAGRIKAAVPLIGLREITAGLSADTQ